MPERSYLCYVRGQADSWEAICVDLDIAVQGRSEDEVRELMLEAVRSYVEDAKTEAPDVAEQLLSRRAPWHVRGRLALEAAFHQVRTRLHGPRTVSTSNFNVPCHV